MCVARSLTVRAWAVMAFMWVAAPQRFEHICRATVRFAQWGGTVESDPERVEIGLAQWPSWLCDRAEEAGVQLPPVKRLHHVKVDASRDGFQLLGLVKLTHFGAQYYTGPASHWTIEGTSECRKQINKHVSNTKI